MHGTVVSKATTLLTRRFRIIAAPNEATKPPDTNDVFLQAIRTLQRRATPGTDVGTAFPKLRRMLTVRSEIGPDRYAELLISQNDCAALIQAWNGAADLVLAPGSQNSLTCPRCT